MPKLSPLGETTIIVSWLMTALALFLLVGTTCSSSRSLAVHDYVLFASFFLGLALVCQTTWAVIEEGMAEHQADLPVSARNTVAKVSQASGAYSSIGS
jgi:uncharacterized protein YcfL